MHLPRIRRQVARQIAMPLEAALPSSQSSDLVTHAVAEAYGRWAPIYDLVFGAVFTPGRNLAIEAANRIGGRVLEVGVGTGMSLPGYARSSRIHGLDIAEPMLEKARKRVAALGLDHVEQLVVMDAERLEYADESFDVVVAQYVVTAVPNPEAALDEFIRVLKPGGEIILTSRVSAEGGLRGRLERLFAPLARRLGWRTDFPWARYQHWLDGTPAVRLAERRALPPLGQFELIRFSKLEAAPQISEPEGVSPLARAAGAEPAPVVAADHPTAR